MNHNYIVQYDRIYNYKLGFAIIYSDYDFMVLKTFLFLD